MKKVIGSALLAAVVFLTACNKKDNDPAPNIPAAAVMAFNLAHDAGGVGVALSGNNLTNNWLNFTNYTGGYLNIYTGNRSVESFNGSSTLAKRDFNFEQDKYYSIFVVGTEGNYSNLVKHDNFDSLSGSSGKAYIRYVNAIPDSAAPRVRITNEGSDVNNEIAAYGTISEFTEVEPGETIISINNEGTINTSRSISLEARKVYTVLLIGSPLEVDETKAVQIRFVENGRLAE